MKAEDLLGPWLFFVGAITLLVWAVEASIRQRRAERRIEVMEQTEASLLARLHWAEEHAERLERSLNEVYQKLDRGGVVWSYELSRFVLRKPRAEEDAVLLSNLEYAQFMHWKTGEGETR